MPHSDAVPEASVDIEILDDLPIGVRSDGTAWR